MFLLLTSHKLEPNDQRQRPGAFHEHRPGRCHTYNVAKSRMRHADRFWRQPLSWQFEELQSVYPRQASIGSRIDLAVASHPHADHLGSMLWVLRNYRVGTYIDNGVQYDSATYRRLRAELQNQIRHRELRYFSHDQAALEDQDFCRARNLNSRVLVPSEAIRDSSAIVTRIIALSSSG